MRVQRFSSSILVGIMAWIAIPTIDAQQHAGVTTESKLHELLTAKRDALKERLDYMRSSYDRGGEAADAVLRAEELLLRTELQLASSVEHRGQICTKRVELFRQLEERAAANVKNGAATMDERWLATARRIQAEIDCLQVEPGPGSDP